MSTPAAPAARAVTWLPLLREALAQEGRFHWRLRGGSMRPTLPDDCEIEIAPLPARVPLGALVVFAAGDTLVAHRLVRRGHGVWFTHGDGRLGPDRPLLSGDLLGIVIAARQAGRLVWPARGAGAAAWFWIARHRVLIGARAARNLLRSALNPGAAR